MKIFPGWIDHSELEFHQAYMTKEIGRIVEGGSFGGRLFGYLYPTFPNWKYDAVCAWDNEHTYIPVDEALSYFADINAQTELPENLMTIDRFKEDHPYANAHDIYFEDFHPLEKFDIISIGQISGHIDWQLQYQHAIEILKDDGIVIARNLLHNKHSTPIRNVIEKYFKIIDYSACGRNAAIQPRK